MYYLRVFFILILVSALFVSCNKDEKSSSDFISGVTDTVSGDDGEVDTPPTTPVLTSILFPGAGTYISGESLEFTFEFDQDVSVAGTPKIILGIGRYNKEAICSLTSSKIVTCSYTLNDAGSNPDLDFDGVSFVETNLDSGSISGTNGDLTADMTYSAPDLSGIMVHYSHFQNWLDANDSSTLSPVSDCSVAISNGDSVACWMDKITGAKTTSSGVNTPLYSASGGANSKGTIYFNSDHVAYPAPVTIQSNYTVISIYSVTAYNTLNYLIGSLGTTEGIGFGFGGTWGGTAGNGLFQISKEVDATSKTMASTVEPGTGSFKMVTYTNQKIFDNASEAAPYAAADLLTVPKTFSKIGQRDDMNGCCDHNGNVSELLIFGKELNQDQLDEVWCYVSDKYQLSFPDC